MKDLTPSIPANNPFVREQVMKMSLHQLKILDHHFFPKPCPDCGAFNPDIPKDETFFTCSIYGTSLSRKDWQKNTPRENFYLAQIAWLVINLFPFAPRCIDKCPHLEGQTFNFEAFTYSPDCRLCWTNTAREAASNLITLLNKDNTP